MPEPVVECKKCSCKMCAFFSVVFAFISVLLIVIIGLLSTYKYQEIILPSLIWLKLKKPYIPKLVETSTK